MKKVRFAPLFPLSKGLDRSSIPGTQDFKSLRIAKNVYRGSRPSLKKRPGQRRIPYIGQDDGVQAAIHFFGTRGAGQFQEVVRVRKGKVEVLRDLSGSEPQFVIMRQDDGDGNVTDLTVSETDTVTFERFINALIIHFENTEPYYYTIGADNLFKLPIISGHAATPPRFSRVHNFRFWYSGRAADPHRIWASSASSISDYTLRAGGFSMRINDGDGDPVGITGISPSFRGKIYPTKWGNLYEVYTGNYGYGWRQVTNEAGCVHHNAMTANRYDVLMVDVSGIQSLNRILSMAGPPEEIALTRNIYDYFQDSVNWSNAKNMIMAYDKTTGGTMLSYAKGGSTANNSVLYMSPDGEFFEWEDIEYGSIAKYWEFGREHMMVADQDRGICLLDPDVNTLEGDAISCEIETDVIFPMGPKMEVNLTQGWILARPTEKSVQMTISTSIDGSQPFTKTVDSQGSGYGATISDDPAVGGVIGTDLIGMFSEDMAIMPFNLEGEGSAVRFNIKHEPSVPDEPLEIYGILYEFSYNEDTEQKKVS